MVMILELNIGFESVAGHQLSDGYLETSFHLALCFMAHVLISCPSFFLSSFRFLSTFYLPWCMIGYQGWVMGLFLAFFHIDIFRGRYISIRRPNNIQFIPNTLLSFLFFGGGTVHAQVVQTRFTQHFGAVHLKNMCSSLAGHFPLSGPSDQ